MGFDRVQYKFTANSKIRKKLLKSSKVSLCFTRKIVLYSLTKFDILKPWNNIQSLRRFDWGFWQTSKQIHRKLQYKQKVFEEFQGMSRFSRKIFMYSSTKFGILKSWANIQSLRTFDLGFWETSKQIYRKLQYRVKTLKSSRVFLTFLEKWFCLRWPNLAFKNLEPIFYDSEDSIYAFDRLQHKFIRNSDLSKKFFKSLKVCLAFPEKLFCIRLPNLAY